MLPRMRCTTLLLPGGQCPELPQDVAAEVVTRRTRQAPSGVEEAQWHSWPLHRHHLPDPDNYWGIGIRRMGYHDIALRMSAPQARDSEACP